MDASDDRTERAIGEALQKASLHGVELCRNAVTKLLRKAQEAELPPPGSFYVEGLKDAVEMIETVFATGLEIAIREKVKHDEQARKHDEQPRKN